MKLIATESENIHVEVVFAMPDRQIMVTVELARNSVCLDAITKSGLIGQFAGTDLLTAPIAVWGRQATHADRLQDRDRVEILRPLQMDPRDARRQRAIRGQFMDGGTATGTEKD